MILSGEHAVVYGNPCLVAAISLRSEARAEVAQEEKIEVVSDVLGRQVFGLEPEPGSPEKGLFPIASVAGSVLGKAGRGRGLKVWVSSQIPPGSGLGSSASVLVAVASACSKALGLDLGLDEIAKLAGEGEKKVHYNPSGVDVEIAVRGGAMVYEKGRPIERVAYPEGMKLVIGFSGVSRRTGDMVRRVAEFAESSKDRFEICLKSIGEVTSRMRASLASSDLAELGRMMTLNHALLCLLGVSTETLDGLVNSAISSRALGAKLTGAGGGGSIVAVCPPGEEGEVARKISESGGVPFVVNVSSEGVRSWAK
ncbi:MAG: mevalonate kinase [Candidatus Brockarchaeota archaeon]|nr:mevalonate kinase [Candidatus Brockarchaeota archaeon]